MGYFASLARQSGFAPAAKPALQRGLEVHLTRPAQPSPATPLHPMPTPLPASGSRRRVGLTADRLPTSRQDAIHEYVAETSAPPTTTEPPHAAASQPSPVGQSPATEVSPSTAVRIASADPATARPERRLPTLADVQDWVSQPVDAAATETAAGPTPLRPRRADPPAPATMPDRGGADNFTLEIGTIQIVVDQQPVLAQPVAPERHSAPTTSGFSDPSRYYLR